MIKRKRTIVCLWAITLIMILASVFMFTACTPADAITDDVYVRGNLYTWNGTAYELVNSGLYSLTNIGGRYGINVETLAGNKTLTPDTDEIYQYLDEGGANRVITLSTTGATAGDRFVVRHNGVYNDDHSLSIYSDANYIDAIHAGGIKGFIFDGTNWISGDIGSGETDTKKYNVSIGYQSRAYNKGVSVGYTARSNANGVAVGYTAYGYTRGIGIGDNANGSYYGVAIGFNATGYNYGVGLGYQAKGRDYGIAIGQNADSYAQRYSIAFGPYSKCYRVGETTTNIDLNSSQKNNVVQGRWSGDTADAIPIEIHLADYSTSRFTIRASSALAFEIRIVARDNTANEVASYSFNGLIKRDGANNTAMSVCNKTVVHEDDATWDCDVTADDVNEAMIITVTGDAANTVQWAAVMNGVETHF